jgi:hypothetical protein
MQTQQATLSNLSTIVTVSAPVQGSVTATTPPATPNTYYVARGNKAVAQHSGNDLHKATTLILQLLPLTQPTPCSNVAYTSNTLTPQEQQQLQQLLLQAAYILETANCTPLHLCKVNVTPATLPATPQVQVYSAPMQAYLQQLITG